MNIGGGEPMLRPDFFEIVEYAADARRRREVLDQRHLHRPSRAERLAAMDYLDIQISIDGADADVNDAGARRRLLRRRTPGDGPPAPTPTSVPFKISIVVTRHNVEQLDEFKAIADSYGAQLRVTRLRPSGRGVDSWDDLHPTQAQQRTLYHWLLDRPDVLTGDSFFHLSALGDALPGLNLCGAGRVVCLIDPVGDVYACPFVIHDQFLAGNVRDDGRLRPGVARVGPVHVAARARQRRAPAPRCGSYDACQGGCMAAKFFVGLELTDPGPGVRAGQRRTAARGDRRQRRCRAVLDGRPLAPRRAGAVAGDVAPDVPLPLLNVSL